MLLPSSTFSVRQTLFVSEQELPPWPGPPTTAPDLGIVETIFTASDEPPREADSYGEPFSKKKQKRFGFCSKGEDFLKISSPFTRGVLRTLDDFKNL
jgi:hypothetical protein